MKSVVKSLLRRVACVVLAAWFVGLVVVPPAFAIDPVEMSDPALQERYRALTHELRCMQCQNQSIADSPVGLAGDLRREVRELLRAGIQLLTTLSDAQFRKALAQIPTVKTGRPNKQK